MRRFLLVPLIGAFAVAPVVVAQTPAGRPLVFVADVAAADALQQDAAALTMALCGALAKDPRVEVICAPDVKEIMRFAVMGALTGASSPAADSLERRLAAVAWVVNGTLIQQPDGLGLVVAAGARTLDDGGVTPVFEAPSARLEESVKSQRSTRLMERLPELSTKLLKPLLVPTTTKTAPPELLK